MQDKLFDFAVKVAVAIFTGGGAVTLVSGEWVGRVAFTAFANELSLHVIPSPSAIHQDVYRDWGSTLLFGSMSENFGIGLLAYLLGGMVLLAHVLAKTLQHGAATSTGPGSRADRLRRTYTALHPWLTAALFVGLILAMAGSSTRVALAGTFLMVAGPGVVYLFSYAQDLRSTGIGLRFAYIMVLVCIVLALVFFPRVYGQRFFDVTLDQAVLGAEYPSGGAAFILPGRSDVVLSIQPDDDRDHKFRLRVIPAASAKQGKTVMSLRTVVSSPIPEAPVHADPEAAFEALLRGGTE